jgi:hypothetical protein
MPLRQNEVLRGVARRLPGLRSYEQRVAELTVQLQAARAELDAAPPPAPPAAQDFGLFAPPGHFYSPIPDVDELRSRYEEIWGRDPQAIAGVDLHLDEQRALLAELAPLAKAQKQHLHRAEAEADGRRYWTDNVAYGAGDGSFLNLMLTHYKPTRLLELGCGYSSACTLDTRQFDLGGRLDITFCDPYPELLHSVMRPEDHQQVAVRDLSTQQIANSGAHLELQPGDVLFVDSTHVARTGSDVNALFFDILPSLNAGVIVHLHDIFPSFEYPPSWVYEKRAWNEQYVLRAFLQFNPDWEIVLWPGLMVVLEPDYVLENFPAMKINAGGAIWLRKIR